MRACPEHDEGPHPELVEGRGPLRQLVIPASGRGAGKPPLDSAGRAARVRRTERRFELQLAGA
jgi:hypothetical protein